MAKAFKVGDRVESLDGEHGCVFKGWPWGVVVRIRGDEYDVQFGDDPAAYLYHHRHELRPDTRGTTEPTRRTTLPVDSAERKRVPLYRGPVRYFPAALAGVARVCEAGNRKHNPDATELTHDRAKSTDQEDCILRHLVDLSEDYGQGVGRDEAGIPQVDYIAWRALALAQAWHEEHDGAPVAPAAINAGGSK